MFCQKCGNQLNEGTRFCGTCGAPVEAAPIPPPEPVCASCGTKLESGVKFCPKCGTPVGAPQAAYQSPPVQPPEPVCASCGTKLEGGVKFCPKCGAQQAAAQTAPQPVYQQPYQQTPPPQGAYQPQGAYPPPSAQAKNPFQYFGDAFKKYAVFSGRARRAEFWWFVLFCGIINVVLGFLDGAMGFMVTENIGGLSLVWGLAIILPSLGVAVRRMHDCDKSGWFLLVPIYDLVLMCTAGTAGPNRFGPDPKQTGV